MPGKPWSKEEQLLLEELAGTRPIAKIAKRLNRSWDAIESQAHRLNISLRPTLNWFSVGQLANYLNCSPTSIKRWVDAGKLKAKQPNRNYQIKLSYLRDFYRRWGDSNQVIQNTDDAILLWLLDFKDLETMAKYQTMWTEDEVNTLLDLAGVIPSERIAKKLNRSLQSVRGKAQLMGISLRTDVDYLSTQQIADLLGCDRTAISYWIEKGMLPCRKSSNTKSGVHRISCRAIKEFYRQKPNIKLWRGVPQENLEWLMGN